jgi:signal transduction histidine kinase/FixJ family two-component response regulator
MSTSPGLLVVDDRDENLVAFGAILDAPDRRLLLARSAREALEILLAEEVALAIVDVQMPEIDGFELAELMRGTRRTRTIPIIFVTAGHHDHDRVFAGYDSGAVDFLAKPIEPRVLRGKAEVFLELHRQRQQLAARVAELEAVLAAVPAAVFMIRDAGRGEVVGNDHARELLRLPKDPDAIPQDGGPYAVVSKGRELPAEVRPLQAAAIDGAERRGCELDIVFAADDRVHLYGNVSPLHAPDGTVRGSVAAFVDVTRLKQADEQLRAADRQKDDFLAALSHELRNPLMPITTSVQVLRRASTSAESGKRALDVIDRQSKHLARLVDDLLDLTRIRNGKVQLRPQSVDLVAALRAVAEDHQGAFVSAGVELALHVPDVRAVVHADPARLAQVVGNLLGNAAKFTPRGGHATLSLAVEGSVARVTIADDGLGIGPETLAGLFRPFAQADRTLDRSRGGLGLGLAVVKSLVEMQGGTVNAQSRGVGAGAEFVVELPLVVSAQEEVAPPSAATAVPATTGRASRVLLVEDNRDGAAMLAEAIRLLGHEVEIVHDGAAALAAARAFRPHVVFCDIGLPGMSGYEVAAALREDDVCRGSRLVAVSGYAAERDRDRAFAAGFDDHMTKPPLLDAVRTAIDAAGHAGSGPRAEGARCAAGTLAGS